VPTTVLKVISVVAETWPFGEYVPVSMGLRATGAVSLVIGHAATCRGKALSRLDRFYLAGVSTLSAFFGSVCCAKLVGSSLPPIAVSLAGALLLVGFLDAARGAFPTGPLATRAALSAALLGSACLIVAGASASRRPHASVVASASFSAANGLLLALLARTPRVPFARLLGQLTKLFGSLALFAANSLALGWPSPETAAAVSGVLDKDLTALLYAAHPAYSATFLALLAAAAYFSLAPSVAF